MPGRGEQLKHEWNLHNLLVDLHPRGPLRGTHDRNVRGRTRAPRGPTEEDAIGNGWCTARVSGTGEVRGPSSSACDPCPSSRDGLSTRPRCLLRGRTGAGHESPGVVNRKGASASTSCGMGLERSGTLLEERTQRRVPRHGLRRTRRATALVSSTDSAREATASEVSRQAGPSRREKRISATSHPSESVRRRPES